MSFCPNCGKQLNDGEVCTCQAAPAGENYTDQQPAQNVIWRNGDVPRQAPPQYQQPYAQQPYGQPPYPQQPYGQPPYPQQPYQQPAPQVVYVQQQPVETTTTVGGCIMAFIGILLLLAGGVGIIVGVVMNNDLETRMRYLAETGKTNPGTIFIIIGAIVSFIGLLLTIFGFSSRKRIK